MQWEFAPGGQRRSPWIQLSDDASDVPGRRNRRPGGREEHIMHEELKEDKVPRTQKAREEW